MELGFLPVVDRLAESLAAPAENLVDLVESLDPDALETVEKDRTWLHPPCYQSIDRKCKRSGFGMDGYQGAFVYFLD
ncbi:hypothetical protein [Brevibacillus dissolubilis]|uniref:hypothetical protein n=1 Tax=Brevibacillus dissolubilis TaxID=1844116 RepID=UPI0011166C7F|nr:hypothetical protein [Brevibacillus dissolubilis]